MGFALFILVTAILFIRPADIVPGLEGVPLYLIAIVPCILLSWHKLIPQLTTAALRERSVFVFGIGILLLSVVTNAIYRQYEAGFATGFSETLIFHLLMLAHLDSPSRLKLFLGCLVGIILIPIVLVVANYHGYISIPSFERMEDANFGVRRLTGTGIFGDPNDICEIVNCAMIFSLYGLFDRGGGCLRIIWAAPLVLFGHALALTQSRGGFLAAMVGLVVLFRGRFRGTKSLVLAGVVVALMFVFFSGRQTSLSTSEGSSQGRIQLWNAGFGLFVRSAVSPVIGIGIGHFNENVGHVAHNAFIQAYVELGFLGGTLLFGQYYYCLTNLATLGSKQVALPDPDMRGLQPFALACLASFATSEMSLTNSFSLITYVMLGLATVFVRLADPSPPLHDLLLSGKLLKRITVLSALFLLSLFVFTKLSLRV